MNLDFVEGESSLEKRRNYVCVLRQLVEVLESTETNNESAALLLDLAADGGYFRAARFLKQASAITGKTVHDLALLLRIEAHERGLIDANTSNTDL